MTHDSSEFCTWRGKDPLIRLLLPKEEAGC